MKNDDKFSNNDRGDVLQAKENLMKSSEGDLFLSADGAVPRSKNKNSLKNLPSRNDAEPMESGAVSSQNSEVIIKKLKDLVGFMLDEGIAEIDIKEGDFSIYIKRRSARAMPSGLVNSGQIFSFIPPDSSLLNGEKLDRSVQKGDDKNQPLENGAPLLEGKRRITSPINGVFYKASSPKSPPFVSEGDTVEPGRTLCIIEAMKVMNEIKADSRMKIIKILVENGATVTQGEPLFVVE